MARKKAPKKAPKKAAKKSAKKDGRPSGKRNGFKGGAFPDPGPSAWLGECLEFCWTDSSGREKIWVPKNGEEWMFMWSPSLKAVWACSLQHGTKLPNVSREGGAAKLFERFTARAASQTQELEVPAPKLKKLGPAKHIVYRSDKWNPGRDIDYIHDFGRDVDLWAGPSERDPQIFMVKGGRLTVTERGIVY